MAAPSSTIWSPIITGDSSGRKGKLGIYTSMSSTGTDTTVSVQVWFWTIYSCTDDNNTLYYDIGTDVTAATTSQGSKAISHTTASGSGWSTANQTKILTKTHTYSRPTGSDRTYKIFARLANIDILGKDVSVSASIAIPKRASYKVTFNANGGSGAPSAQTKYYGRTLTLSSTTPTRTGYTFQGWSTSASGSVVYKAGGSYTANAAATLYAVWKANTYTITFNANGGSGAPAAQTKTYGVNLTLSSTKPTRSGYSFLGWSTSSTATTATYSAGGSYTANAAATLYAVWKANTYKITFNANGGSGAPSAQTKTHGVNLTLSSTIPTRENYTFLGWGDSATSTTVLYAAGATYKANSAATLYAIWELSYVKPRINVESVSRCYSTGEITDAGRYAYIKLSWECDKPIQTASIQFKSESANQDITRTLTANGTTSGTIDQIVGITNGAENITYTVIITIADASGSSYFITTLQGTRFAIDVMAEEKGIAFNKNAELEGVMDIGYKTYFRGGILYHTLVPETDLDTVTAPGFYVGENVSSNNYGNCPITAGTFTLEVLSGGDVGQVLQRLSLCNKLQPTVYKRFYYSNTWGDWECENPPMLVGVEYRTTKLHNGKVVYMKLVDLGALPNKTNKGVGHGISETATIIGFEAFTKSTTNSIVQQFPLISVSGTTNGKVHVSAVGVDVYAFADLSSYNAWIIIRYTKD